MNGEAWVPGLSGQINFICQTQVEDVMGAASAATGGSIPAIDCQISVSSGPVDANMEQSLGPFEDTGGNPSCYV